MAKPGVKLFLPVKMAQNYRKMSEIDKKKSSRWMNLLNG